MSLFFMAAFSLLARTLPYRALAYYPFRDRLRLPVWAVAVLISVTELAHMILYGYIVVQGGTGWGSELFFALVCMAVYFSCIRAEKGKLLFLYVFVMDYNMIIQGITVFAESRFFYAPDMTFHSWRSMAIHLAMLAVTAPAMLLFLRRTKERVFHTDAPVFWRVVWLVPAFTTLIVLMFTGGFGAEQAREWRFLLARVLLMLGLYFVYYVLLHALDNIRAQAALEERNAQQEQIISLQRGQHEYLKKYMEETRQARHDLRQHLMAIQGYLDSGDRTALQDYITAYTAALPADAGFPYCQNYALDVVVRYYAQEAGNAGIDFDVQIDLPEKLPVNEPEFCALVGNLLENAVDASRRVTDEAAFIRMNIRQYGANLVVVTDNTYGREPEQKDGRLLSSKHDGFGIGTQSIRAIAARYGGTAEFLWNDGEFHASVLLRKTE